MSGDLRKRLLQALLLATSLASVLCVAEVALTLGYRAKLGPGNWVQTPGIGSPYAHNASPGRGDINNLALRRDTDTHPGRPAGAPRVLSYGDSVAHGFGVSNSETYAGILERQLRDQLGQPVEVLNMFRGHSPTVHSFHIRRDVPRLLPDAVLLEIEVLNDVPDEAFIETFGTDEYGLPAELLAARYIVGLDGHLLSPASSGASLGERTVLFAKFRRWLGRQRSKWADNPLFSEHADTGYYALNSEQHLLTQRALDRGFDRMFESIAGIHQYLASRGIEFQLLLMPSRDIYEDGPNARGALRLFQRAEARAAELGLPTLSLRTPLEVAGGAGLFMDFCHPTAAGNAAIATAIFVPVREMITGASKPDMAISRALSPKPASG